MCGIAGIYNFKKKCVDPILLQKMADILKHRGPDDEGYYIQKNVGLANRRLSIIDLKSGRQPIFNEDRSMVIVYNGEIYNYKDIRENLLKMGHHFYTETDTEVVVHAYEKWGNNCLSRFNGMFVFAIWDNRKKELFLARDRLGIKPLYYYFNKSKFIFASEIKSILPCVSQRQENLNAIYEFLTFQNILSNNTFFKNIYKLLPGHYLLCTSQGININCYWDVSFRHDYEGSFRDAAQEYKRVLQDSVTRHLIADVPVGSYLSGGFDSTSVATIAAGRMNKPIHTFTGAFTDAPYYDERKGSRTVAQNIEAFHHEIEITPQDYLQNIGKVIYYLDEPTLGTGAFPQYMVSKLVSHHLKVVLTGHGGDEMFAGYQVNKVALIKETLRRNPKNIGSVLWGIKKDEWSRVLYFLLYPLLYPEVGSGLFIMIPKKKRAFFFTQEFLNQNKDFEPLDIFANIIKGKDKDLPGERILRLYLKTYLPTLFIQEDKMSMAHSVEARTPICDNQMVDLALKLPLRLKLHNNRLKAITRAAMRSRLPEVLYTLPKRGFPTPLARWYRHKPLKSLMEDLLFSKRSKKRGIFNISTLRKIFEHNLYSKHDTLYDYARANQLYSASIVELWFRTFIDQKEPVPIL